MTIQYPSGDVRIDADLYDGNPQTWSYQVTLSDLPENDGILTFLTDGTDAAGNNPSTYINFDTGNDGLENDETDAFVLDNTSPSISNIHPLSESFMNDGGLGTLQVGYEIIEANNTLESADIEFKYGFSFSRIFKCCKYQIISFFALTLINIVPLQFEAYANRDSLSYREVYKLNDIPTLFRGTLRMPGYSEAWDLFVQMGMTDDSYEMDVSGMNYSDFFNSFIDVRNRDIKSYLKSHFRVSDDVISKVEWLGFFNQINLGLDNGTPAQILQKILESKWLLQKEDKDM